MKEYGKELIEQLLVLHYREMNLERDNNFDCKSMSSLLEIQKEKTKVLEKLETVLCLADVFMKNLNVYEKQQMFMMTVNKVENFEDWSRLQRLTIDYETRIKKHSTTNE